MSLTLRYQRQVGSAGGGSAAWPDATNTGLAGAGVSEGSLTTVSGFTAAASTTYELLNVNDAIYVPSGRAGIIIRKCKLNAGYFGVDAFDNNDGILIEDCTIIGGSNCGLGLGQNATVRRCHIYGGTDAIKCSGGLTLEDCYIHDLAVGVETHNDAVQFAQGAPAGNTIIRHNWIESNDTSCLFFGTQVTSGSNILVENNYLGSGSGGPVVGYLIYCPGGAVSNVDIVDNYFGSWGYWAATDWANDPGNSWSNNRKWSDNSLVDPA